MKIVQVHNYYQQAGGEDGVVAAEQELLRSHGHEVVTYSKNNASIVGGWRMIVSGLKTLWNWETYREVRELLRKEKPDLLHCHNTFPLISPSIYWACAREGVPVVQTVHNFRLLCISAFLFRESPKGATDEDASCSGASGAVCELCLKKSFKWPGIKYSCYRGSKVGSLVATVMLWLHRLSGTWSGKISAYISLTEFQKRKLIAGGFPEDRIWVKPNFMEAPPAGEEMGEGVESGSGDDSPYALFVGRHSVEKGCDVLIRAWALYQESRKGAVGADYDVCPQLLIVGDGPERRALEELARGGGSESVKFIGRKSRAEVITLMRDAQFLVLPSVWYEGFPMTIVESFSCGTPVVATDDGGMQEIIEENRNGLKFALGEFAGLAEKLEWAFDHPEEMKEMGLRARRDFEERYSAVVNYEILMGVYERVLSGGV